MRNQYPSPGTEAAIDKQVAKLLKGLGNPEPPLHLELVLELLKLDAQFYTTTEDGVFRETISRIKVGTIQVFKRPMLLLEAITKAELKALYIPDKRRILVDSTLPDLKVRWHTAHEIIHSICDWHGDVMFGDNLTTLSPGCHEQVEAEANFGAGRLITLQDRFTGEVAGATLTLKEVSNLAKQFGNTWTSTLWRVVETMDIPAFAVVGSHPKRKGSTEPCRYFIRSRRFVSEYSDFTEADALTAIRTYCDFKTRGPLGVSEVMISNGRGEGTTFLFESFATKYDVLTFAYLTGKASPIISIPTAEIIR